jgi:uncharacterized membrane protein YGL010W
MAKKALHPRMRQWFDEYADAHRSRTNQLIHKIAIPLIVFHVVAMLSWVPLWKSINLGSVAGLAAALFYCAHHAVLGVIMTMSIVVMLLLSPFVPWQVVVGIAIFAWAIQLIGHSVYEKNRPAFLKNMMQALVGPFFFLAVALGVYKPSQHS